jgi:hypothetical protein
LQTDVAWGGGCCWDLFLTNPCNLYGVGPVIVDCGPCPGQFPPSYNVYCYNSSYDRVISCVTAGACMVLCQSNPIGLGYVQVQASGLNRNYIGCPSC